MGVPVSNLAGNGGTLQAIADHVAEADPHTQYQKESEKGAANGYASLDGAGLVPSGQLPSYVDDVLEYANFAALPITGETGKIYVTLDNGRTYRWSGSLYIRTNNPNMSWPLPIILHSTGAAPAPSYFTLLNMGYWEFTKAVAKTKVVGGVVLPAEFDAAVNPNVTFRVITSALGAGNGNAQVEVTAKYFTSLGNAGGGVSQTLSATPPIVNVLNDVAEVTIALNAALMQALGYVTVSAVRVPGHANDTFTGAIAVAEVAVLPVKETV